MSLVTNLREGLCEENNDKDEVNYFVVKRIIRRLCQVVNVCWSLIGLYLQIHLVKEKKNNEHYNNAFHLNGHTVGFHPHGFKTGLSLIRIEKNSLTFH